MTLLVKDYQLIQSQDSTTAGLPRQSEGQGSQKTVLHRYLSNFTSIISHLLQTSMDSSSPDAVEASWVLSLALKGLYNTLKVCAVICNCGTVIGFVPTPSSDIWIVCATSTESTGLNNKNNCRGFLFSFHVVHVLYRSTEWSKLRRPSSSQD